jgi:hypothetical protein
MLLGRGGGDLRWPYRDGDPRDADGLAACDVRRMRDALAARDYEVFVVPGAADEGEIVKELNAATRACTSGDTFLFYFSGHTRVRRGRMQLVLGHSAEQQETLSATVLIEKLDACKAGAKLIILDCCYAGEATQEWRPPVYENLRILAATDRATPAGEFDELEGGIFTHFLHEALTNPEHWTDDGSGVTDADGAIWSDALSEWLKERIGAYAGSRGRRVGEPLEYVGSDKQRVQIARIDPRERHRSRAATFRIAELVAHLAGLAVAPETLRSRFDDLLDKIEPAYTKPRPAPTAPLIELLAFLADMGVRNANVPVALLELVQLLAETAPESARLRDWIERVADDLERAGELSSKQRGSLGESVKLAGHARHGALTLLVAPGHWDATARTFASPGAWFEAPDSPRPTCVAVEDTDIDAHGVGGLIASALSNEAVGSRLRRPSNVGSLTLEVFLPAELLRVDVDGLVPRKPNPYVPVPPVSYHYNLVVRPWERVAAQAQRCWTEGWDLHWGRCADCRARSDAADGCVAWIDGPASDYGARLDRGDCLFIVRSPPEMADVVRPLTQGVAKLLWCDEPMPADLQTRLREKMAGKPLRAFPDLVREVRMRTWVASGEEHTGHLHLLWDDPGRKPPSWGDPGRRPPGVDPAPPLTSPYDQYTT